MIIIVLNLIQIFFKFSTLYNYYLIITKLFNFTQNKTIIAYLTYSLG